MTIHDPQIGIQLTYTIPNVEADISSPSTATSSTTTSDVNTATTTPTTITHQKTFLASNFPPARMGLPDNIQPQKPEAGSYIYSGMHDTGPLICPKEDGIITQLIASIQHAKDYNDTYLTQIIEHEQQQQQNQADKSSIDESQTTNSNSKSKNTHQSKKAKHV